jgi:hypothetical protein
MFSRVKPAGWAFGEILASSHMNAIDTNQSNAVDGSAGGTYAPSTRIRFNGAGFACGTVSEFTGTNTTLGANVTQIGTLSSQALSVIATSQFWAPVTFLDPVSMASASLSGALSVTGAATFSGATTTAGLATFNGAVRTNAQVSGYGNVHFYGSLDVDGLMSMSGNVNIGSGASDAIALLGTLTGYAPVLLTNTLRVVGGFTLDHGAVLGTDTADTVAVNANLITFAPVTHNGTTLFNNVATFAAVATHSKQIQFTGEGRVTDRTIIGSNTNANYSLADASVIVCNSLTGNASYAIGNSLSAAGDWIKIITREAAYTLTVSFNSTDTIVLQYTTGQPFSVKLRRASGIWVLEDVSRLP